MGAPSFWIPESPWLLGDPELTAMIKTRLFVRSLHREQIAVTPTGPWVRPHESERWAVFAVGNEVTRFTMRWTPPPDVTFGADPGTIF